MPAFLIFAWPGRAVSQYRVSGVVEFTYRNFETKTGNSATSSDQYWTQTYRANLQGHLLDPRFMRFSGGVGYSVYTYKNAADSSILDYNLNTTFFPGMKVSWNLFGSKSINTVESAANIAGYDVTTTTYGGTLTLNPGKGGNNNNRNTNGWGYPTINLSRIHTESESQSTTTPLHETRDDTKAGIYYRISPNFDLNVDGSMEEYENLNTGGTYDTKTANLTSTIRVTPNADLKLSGRLTDRGTENIAGFEKTDITQAYNATLDFKEKDGLRHYYRYDFTEHRTTSSELATHKGEARVTYKMGEDLRVQAGVDYNVLDYVRKPTPTDLTGEKTGLASGGLLAGALYRKKYTPAFMGPFAFDTGYDFTTGFSRVTSETGGPVGGGWYYTNSATLGLSSIGWQKENLSVSYNYNNKRDSSPLHNDIWMHSYRFAVSTARIPKTSIRGSASYTTQENKSEYSNIGLSFPTFGNQQAGINQQRRSLTYDMTVDHALSSSVSLVAGASRGQTTSTYTLSNLPSIVTQDKLFYAAANLTYPITRNLLYRAQLREENRHTQASDTRSHQANMYLDYRIRRIFVNVEFRWREDIPEGGSRTEQQYYYVKLSRPF